MQTSANLVMTTGLAQVEDTSDCAFAPERNKMDIDDFYTIVNQTNAAYTDNLFEASISSLYFPNENGGTV